MLAPMRIRDWPIDERPREKLLARGPAALTDGELLAIMLRTGTAGRSALDLAKTILSSFGTLRKLLAADRQRFCAHLGLGTTRYAELQAALEIGRRQYAEALHRGPALSTFKATQDFLFARIRDLEYEQFCCLYLDNRHRLIHFSELFRGTIDAANVYPREIVKQALQHNCAAVILAHNHPSGVADPSTADQLITGKIREALNVVDIRLLDHIVIGANQAVSMAHRGLL
jgi:DNA repair protein RadC